MVTFGADSSNYVNRQSFGWVGWAENIAWGGKSHVSLTPPPPPPFLYETMKIHIHTLANPLQEVFRPFNRLRANKNFNCALRNAVTGARETQRIDCLVGG